MKKISDIYKEYKIMNNLQMHQYRVAAVASQLCDSLDVDLDKNLVITAALLHDMGNIIKFDLAYFPEFNKPEGLEYWQSVKDDFISRYGTHEGLATAKIMRELGVSEQLVSYMDHLDFAHICKTKENTDLMFKVIKYSDLRVGPHGVLMYKDRMHDVKIRYQDREHLYQDSETLIECGRNVEKQVFAHSKIKPEDINDESVASIIEELKNFEI